MSKNLIAKNQQTNEQQKIIKTTTQAENTKEANHIATTTTKKEAKKQKQLTGKDRHLQQTRNLKDSDDNTVVSHIVIFV